MEHRYLPLSSLEGELPGKRRQRDGPRPYVVKKSIPTCRSLATLSLTGYGQGTGRHADWCERDTSACGLPLPPSGASRGTAECPVLDSLKSRLRSQGPRALRVRPRAWAQQRGGKTQAMPSHRLEARSPVTPCTSSSQRSGETALTSCCTFIHRLRSRSEADLGAHQGSQPNMSAVVPRLSVRCESCWGG